MVKTILRWLRRAALVAVVILVPMFLLRWWNLQQANWKGQADLEKAIEETTALDARWRWEQIQEDRPEIPEEENSMRILLPLGKDLEPLELSKVEQLEGNRFAFAAVEPNRLVGTEDREILKRIVLGNEALMTRARSLKDHPRGHHQVELAPLVPQTPMPHLQPLREIVWLQGKDLEWHLDQNQPQKAVQTIQAMINTGNAIQNEDLSITSLVRVGIRSYSVHAIERILGMSELNKPDLVRLQDLMSQQAEQRPAVKGLRGERASMNTLMDNFRSGVVPISRILDAAGPDGKGAAGLWMRWVLWEYSFHLPGEQADMLRWLNRAIEVANQPFESQVPQWECLRDEALETRREIRWMSRGFFTTLMAPAIVLVGESGVRDHAYVQMARIALSAEQFRRDNQRWPNTLDDLVGHYLKEKPIDPYSGSPYLLRAQPDGLVIYSAGKNGVDDGGERVHSRHFLEPDSDLGIRLWNPDQRRLPARVAMDANPNNPDENK